MAHYTINEGGTFKKREKPRTIRNRNYDMSTDLNNYKREMVMVTLHISFKNEETDILADMKFLDIYSENERFIIEARKEFELNLDIEKTLQICRQMCRNHDGDNRDDNNHFNAGNVAEPNPFQQLYQDPNSVQDDDLRLALLNKLGPIAKKKRKFNG